MAIARSAVKNGNALPKSSLRDPQPAGRQAAKMDVDRISSIGGVGQEQNPAWTRNKLRRRKFAEDVPPETSAETESPAEPAEDADHGSSLDVIA